MKSMPGALFLVVLFAGTSVAVAQDAAGPSEAGPNSPPPVIKGANDKPTPEQERQFFLGMVAIKDYCKETIPTRSAEFDAVWARSAADVPAPILEFAKTDAFEKQLKTRMIFLRAAAQRPEGKADLEAACTKMVAAE